MRLPGDKEGGVTFQVHGGENTCAPCFAPLMGLLVDGRILLDHKGNLYAAFGCCARFGMFSVAVQVSNNADKPGRFERGLGVLICG